MSDNKDDNKTRTRITDKPESKDLTLPSEKYKKELQSDGSVMESFKKKKLLIDSKYISNKATVKFITPLMVSGNIYIFDYNSKNVSSNKIHDKRPIVYSLGQIKNNDGVTFEVGINLNLIPTTFKMAILDRLFIATRTLQTTFSIQKRIGYFPVTMDMIKRILENTGYRYALWQWVPQRINNKIVLEYSDWYLPLHMLPYEVKGINLSSLGAEYLKNLKLK